MNDIVFGKQSVELVTIQDPMLRIATCAAVCYNKKPPTTREAAENYVVKIVKQGHTSILEHYYCRLHIPTALIDLFRQAHASMEYFDFDEYDNGTTIMTGNVRAWYDFMGPMTGTMHRVLSHYPRSFNTRMSMVAILAQETSPLLFTVGDWVDNGYRHTPIFYSGENVKYCTFRITTTLSVASQIRRHRTLSPTQESARYVDYTKNKDPMVINSLLKCNFDNEEKKGAAMHIWHKHMDTCVAAYRDLIAQGCPPQTARSVLPQDFSTVMFMTGTEAAWRSFLKQRLPVGVDPMCHEVATMISAQLKTLNWEIKC